MSVLKGLVKPSAWMVHSPTRQSQFDEYPCLYTADRESDARNHARLMGAKCEPLYPTLDLAKVEALVEAAEELAKMADRYDSREGDGDLECWSGLATPKIKHLRNLRAALAAMKGGDT